MVGQKLFRPVRVPTGTGLFTNGSVSSPLRSAWRSSYSRDASLMSCIWAWQQSEAVRAVEGGSAYFGEGRTSSGDEEAIAALSSTRLAGSISGTALGALT